MSPALFPTYKKIPFRGRVKMSDPDWVTRVYVSQFKEPFYKGALPFLCACGVVVCARARCVCV